MTLQELKQIEDMNEAAVFPDKLYRKLCKEIRSLRAVIDLAAGDLSVAKELGVRSMAVDRAIRLLTGI